MSVNPKQSPGFAKHVRLPMSVANYYKLLLLLLLLLLFAHKVNNP